MTPVPQFVQVPLPGGATSQEPTALYQLQEAAQQDIRSYTQFLAGSNSSQYANPAAYTANMISYAKSLCYHSWSSYICVGFDPTSMGQQYAQVVFDALKQIILPSTGKSVYDTWVSGGGPAVVGSAPAVNGQGAFNPTSVGPIQVPQNPNYIPAGKPGFISTPPIPVIPVVTMSGQPIVQQSQPDLPQPITQNGASAGTVSDNKNQSTIAQQGGANVQSVPTPISANVTVGAGLFASLGLPGLDTTILGIPLGFLGIAGLAAIMLMGNEGTGRKGRYA